MNLGSKLRYQRILLKISGEILSPPQGWGIFPLALRRIGEEIIEVKKLGIELALVMGGGNIFRGSLAKGVGLDRVAADYIGMLATVINALALQDVLEQGGLITRVQSAINMERLAEPYIRRRAIRHLEKNRIVIMAAGTGNPYFTTDTAAALRAVEIGAEVILKGTKVDGVYTEDPLKNRRALKYDRLTYMEVLKKGLKVMDATAISLCMENELPIIVFNLVKKNNLKKIILGEKVGTVVEK